jgi:DNA-directed RNA polymerase specialized sigma24 family protein
MGARGNRRGWRNRELSGAAATFGRSAPSVLTMERIIATWMPALAVESSEQRRVASARGSEPEALDAPYHLRAANACSLALPIIGQANWLEDVAQDAFLRAFKRFGSYRDEAPVGAWLNRIAANSAIDRLLSERRLTKNERLTDALIAPELVPTCRATLHREQALC